MNNRGYNRKYKSPKQKTSATTNPKTSISKQKIPRGDNTSSEPLCPLLAKDSEWVDALQTNSANVPNTSSSVSDDEEILQLVDCEDGPQTKPLAIMFPGLLDKDPQMLQGMLDRAMSTTEVTKHLVDLGQKANFTFMKKSDRLIPREKQWLEILSEVTNSDCSIGLATPGATNDQHTSEKSKRH